MGSPRCQSFRPLAIALRQTVAPSFSRLHQRYPQRFVWTDKMIVRTPPLQMGQQLRSLLGRGPGATSQCRYSMSERQIHPFNKGGVQPSRETQSL